MSTSMIALAAPGNALVGEITISGNDNSDAETAVTLNGEPILSGRTFVSSGLISTSATRSATINLGKLGRVSLSPKSVLSLTLAESGISGQLSSGQIEVFSKEGVSVTITTSDDVVTNDPSKAGSFTVDVSSGSTVATGEANLANGTAAAARLSKKEKAWIIVPIVAAIIIIAIVVADDDEDDSPVR